MVRQWRAWCHRREQDITLFLWNLRQLIPRQSLEGQGQAVGGQISYKPPEKMNEGSQGHLLEGLGGDTSIAGVCSP